ncbi:FmdB family zinc ribbon protein [Nitrospira lenta]|uniref:Putative Regulatory protein, FmdB family n=1 Tax=Nitrospira lenta TaxID=1436998 RepID=A0A330L278_9BACT|nr:FmdB family zinc ribbon protein [Nitrospira lenta]SPP63313.1 putative Regulatory protein, FmdB family [Nitrospira lenta]
MPIYEYFCRDCRKRSTLLILSLSSPTPPACKHCGSLAVDRLLSGFSSPKSEEARLASLSDSDNLDGLDENDPESMSRFMKHMGDEMGEDVEQDVEAMMDSADNGASHDGSTDSL